jgi:hypothetical protein
MELHSNGRLLALPTNIRLGWQEMALTGTLAYCVTATVKAVKGFTVQVPAHFVLESGATTFSIMTLGVTLSITQVYYDNDIS